MIIVIETLNRAFGTMAFICVFVTFFITALIFKGRQLQRYNLISARTEDGVRMNGKNEQRINLEPEQEKVQLRQKGSE